MPESICRHGTRVRRGRGRHIGIYHRACNSATTRHTGANPIPVLARPDDFFAEYPATAGSDKVDTAEAEEVIDAIAKTVAELTSQQDGIIRRQVIEHLMRQIMHHDAEFRREETTSAVVSIAKH